MMEVLFLGISDTLKTKKENDYWEVRAETLEGAEKKLKIWHNNSTIAKALQNTSPRSLIEIETTEFKGMEAINQLNGVSEEPVEEPAPKVKDTSKPIEDINEADTFDRELWARIKVMDGSCRVFEGSGQDANNLKKHMQKILDWCKGK